MKISARVILIVKPGESPEMRELPDELDHKKQQCKKGDLPEEFWLTPDKATNQD